MAAAPIAAIVYLDANNSSSFTSLSANDLTATFGIGSSTLGTIRATAGKSSGKWTWQVTVGPVTGSNTYNIGIALSTFDTTASAVGTTADSWSYRSDGTKMTNAFSGTAYGATYTTGDVIRVDYDATAGAVTFYKNGASQGVAYTGVISGTGYPAITGAQGDTTPASVTAAFDEATLGYSPAVGYAGLDQAADSVPAAPTIGTAVLGNASATVAFTAGATGGSAITGYTATSTPGSFTGTGASSPLTVNGLTNGTAYTFTVHATNGIGDSSESAASNSVTPATVPGAPTIGTATVLSITTVSAAFSAPASTGGSAITGYTVTSSPGSITATGASSPITVTGLTTGTPYTFTVTATNAIGTGSASAASNEVTPAVPNPVWAAGVFGNFVWADSVWFGMTGTPAVPLIPTIGTAVADDASAFVAFTPSSSQGSAITEYRAISTPGSFTGVGSGSPITVTGLSNATAYTFTVRATNAIGNSGESAASNSVTPVADTVPVAPTIGTATASSSTQATVAFTPGADGGSPITSYRAISTPGSITGTGSGSPITVSGLTTSTAYTFTVRATNAIGNSSESSASNSVTPT